jgi:hypothetical protein
MQNNENKTMGVVPQTEMPNTPFWKSYLGDGVYAEIEDRKLKLTTEDGYSVSNTIYLEPQVWDALVAYVKLIETRTPPFPPSYYDDDHA